MVMKTATERRGYRYYHAHKKEAKAAQLRCKLKNPERWRESTQRRNKRSYARLKRMIFEKLGNMCKRCGIEDVRVLCVDHVYGGGRKERRSVRTHYQVWKRALLDTEGRYQILCHNCNWIKKSENLNEHGGAERKDQAAQLAA
jgi:hypothetical protein